MSDQEQQRRKAAQTQTESQAAAAAHKFGLQSQVEAVNRRKQNPEFYDKFTGSSIEESEKWSHLTNEHAPWLADDHILGNRRKVHRRKREMLNKTRAEEAITGATPGPRCREKPLLNALMQGVNPRIDRPIRLDAGGQSAVTITDPAYTPPMDAEEKTGMHDLAEVATSRQSMAVEQAGNEALTKATSENKTLHEEETDQSGVVGSVSGVFD